LETPPLLMRKEFHCLNSWQKQSTELVVSIVFSLQCLPTDCMCWLLVDQRALSPDPLKHSLLPHTGRWIAGQGVKALRPTSRKCIPVFVSCQAGPRGLIPDSPNQVTSIASTPTEGGKLLGGAWKHWDLCVGTASWHMIAKVKTEDPSLNSMNHKTFTASSSAKGCWIAGLSQ
jgi:hypothetical protein